MLQGTIRQLSPGRFLDISSSVRVRVHISAIEDTRRLLIQQETPLPHVRRYLPGRWVIEDPTTGRKTLDVQMTPEGLELEAKYPEAVAA